MPSGAAAAACRALDDRLPRRLDDRAMRAVTPRSPYIRAWGRPAVVLRCGGERPADLRPTSQLLSVNDVDWFVEEHADGSWTATTVGRVANVEVRLPRDVTAGALADLAAPIRAAVPTAARASD